MPFSPPIAEATHTTGWLIIRITADGGIVTKAEVLRTETQSRGMSHPSKSGSQLLTAPTLEYLKSWRFSSDVNGSFVVKFTYSFAGTETEQPTNPTVEVLPPLDVNVIARPVKLVVEY